jgi:hypothetical protein
MLCDLRGKLLYEVRPDMFTFPGLCETERELWSMYYDRKNKSG